MRRTVIRRVVLEVPFTKRVMVIGRVKCGTICYDGSRPSHRTGVTFDRVGWFVPSRAARGCDVTFGAPGFPPWIAPNSLCDCWCILYNDWPWTNISTNLKTSRVLTRRDIIMGHLGTVFLNIDGLGYPGYPVDWVEIYHPIFQSHGFFASLG